MIQFLIDENLSPRLVETAHAFGCAAFHVAHRGWAALQDPQILRRAIDEGLTLVTNNWDDFRPMLRREELHPGIVVVLPSVWRDRQMELFAAALTVITNPSAPLDMINTVVEVDSDAAVMVYAMRQDPPSASPPHSRTAPE